jgi:hypothetical protein
MFVYKKTIYEINSEYRKLLDTNNDNNDNININFNHIANKDVKFDLLNSYIEIYKLLIRLEKPKVLEISEIINKIKCSSSYLQKILTIVNIFADKMMDNNNQTTQYPLFILLLKKMFTEQLDNKILNKLKNKLLLDEEFTEVILCNIIPSSV